MSTAVANAEHPDMVKKWMTCLGCSRRIWTDRCHRICKKCRRRNSYAPARTAHHISLPHGMAVAETERSSQPTVEW